MTFGDMFWNDHERAFQCDSCQWPETLEVLKRELCHAWFYFQKNKVICFDVR